MANSFVRYTGNNSTTAYSIPFSYISTNDLTVTLAGVATTAFTLNAAGTTLTFNSPPASNVAIEIRRTTSQTTRLTDYASGSVLTENDLDTDSEQAFFMGQEAIDDANDVIKISNVNFQYDATNKRITNVADPVNAQDLATKNYLENTFLTTANKTALTTINANIANIIAVNNNASNINSAVSNATNINTVATNIGSVNTVATDIAKVITVANDLAEAVSEVETVADDLNETSSEIDTVAGAITNVNNVGNNIANVNTVAGISSNVTTVAGNNSNVSTVAGISGDVTAVAGISSDVQAVENIKANVTTVAGISSNVTSVAGISTAVSNVNSNSSNINAVNSNATNINTVAGNNSNISTVAGVSSDVTTVAGISSDVSAVENIASNVTTVAGMSTAINTVNSNATNVNAVGGAIANVNNVGGSIASVNSVATNLASVNSFANTYLGASGSAPTQDPDGSALDLGDLYFDTGSNQLKVYSSTGWVNAGSSVNGTSERFKYTISGTPTTISGNDDNSKSLSYDAGFIDVFLNGIKMVNGTDVTVTSGNSVVFASALTNGDVVDIITFGTFNIASMNASNLSSGTVPDARITGAYTGITNLSMTGNLLVGTTSSSGFDAGGLPLLVGNGSTHQGLTIYTGTSHTGAIHFADGTGTGSYRGQVNYRHDTDAMTFATSGGEKVRLDANGNFLVGKTTTGIGSAGAEFKSDGRLIATVSGNYSALLNRLSSDGDIVQFRKDGTSVGSISAISNDLCIFSSASNHSGLRFGDSSIFATNNSGVVNDNTVDFGSPNLKFKDIYLGGGAFIGGTGTANKLDDYEEGTWSPSFNFSETVGFSGTISISHATYTKIGNFVSLNVQLGFGASSGTLAVGDKIRINGGIPFAQKSSGNYGGTGGTFAYNANNSAGVTIQPMSDNGFRAFITSIHGSMNRNGGAMQITFNYQAT
jgi:hypothetical protein